jgi:tripartite-type tricarboxylate transporter receptor subunit TctC
MTGGLRTRVHLAQRALLILALALAAGAAAAETWPSRTIKIVVPCTPGGSSDIIARAVSQPLSDALKQTVMVENKPGANGNAGTNAVAKSPADGYTLLLCDVGALAITPSVYTRLPFDLKKNLGRSKSTREPLLPDVPTIAEQGVASFESGTWQGVLVPAGTPNEVVARLAAELTRIIRSPDMRARPSAQGAEVRTTTPAEFAAFFEREQKRWASVVASGGVRIE